MTDKLRDAAQQALDVLEQLQGGCTDSDDGTVEVITVWCPEVIDALRAALAQQGGPSALCQRCAPVCRGGAGCFAGMPDTDPAKMTIVKVVSPEQQDAQAVPQGWIPPSGLKVADIGFRWDGDALQHVPHVLVEFAPVPANLPNTEKGWADRDAFVEMLNAAPTQQAQQGAQAVRHEQISDGEFDADKRLMELADKIDHEQNWRLSGIDQRDRLTQEQQDRVIAGVMLRRYANLMAPDSWRLFPPTRLGIGITSFRASTLEKVVEMARKYQWVSASTTPPAQQKHKPLFAEMIAQHPGLAEELAQQDAQPESEAVRSAWLAGYTEAEREITAKQDTHTWAHLPKGCTHYTRTGDERVTLHFESEASADAWQAASPTPQAQQPLTVEQYTEIAHRTASRYAHRSDPKQVCYTFFPHTLDDFVRRLESAHNIGTKP